MKESQEDIYYPLAPSLAAAKSSPHLEAFRTKGVEVLLLGEGVDNCVVPSLREFDGKKLQSVAQAVRTLGARIEDPASFVTRLNQLRTALTEEEGDEGDEGEETVG